MKTFFLIVSIFCFGCTGSVSVQPFKSKLETDPQIVTAINALGTAVKAMDERLKKVEVRSNEAPSK